MLTFTDKTKFAEGKTRDDVKVGDDLSAKYSEKDGMMMAWEVITKKEKSKMEYLGEFLSPRMSHEDVLPGTNT